MADSFTLVAEECELFIEKERRKGRVPNSDDVTEVLERCLDGEHEAEQHELVESWIGNMRIYRAGDAASYLRAVRDRGLIASREGEMMREFQSRPGVTRRVQFVDTEFPVDATGRYRVTPGLGE